MNIENLPSCYPVYQLFITALESSPEERETIIEAAFAALKNLGFNPKGSFLPIHDAEGDDFCSQPLRSLSDTSHIIVQAGQYLAKHTPENEQKEEGKVKEISEKVFNIWNNKRNCLHLEGVKLIKGLEIGRPGRGEFSEDIKPFELKEGSLQEVVKYLNSQEDKSVKILLNAPGYTLAQLIEDHPDLLKQKIHTIYMSGFASVNSTDGMTSVLKLIELVQSKDANIQVIIRDGTVFRPAEDLNFIYMQALHLLANKYGSSQAAAQLEAIEEWKQFDTSSRRERAAVGRDVSEATKQREERLQTIKKRVENITNCPAEEQTVLSDLFMYVLAYTNEAQLVTEDFSKIDVKREFKPRSRERGVELHPAQGPGIFKRIRDLQFNQSTVQIGNNNISIDKDSYLAMATLFTLLKKSN